jgi:hypothetical protein
MTTMRIENLSPVPAEPQPLELALHDNIVTIPAELVVRAEESARLAAPRGFDQDAQVVQEVFAKALNFELTRIARSRMIGLYVNRRRVSY